MSSLPKTLFILGGVLVFLGLLIYLFSKVGIEFGKLPGDINLSVKKISFQFPIVTSIALSLILTIILNLIFWIVRR
jgi:hypothetical protein